MAIKEKNGGDQETKNGSEFLSNSTTSDDEITAYIPTPPDGGWGWMIVASSFLCNVVVDGIGYSFGIFLPVFIEYFNETRSKVSLVGSLLCGTCLCAGPIVGGLTNKFGCRPVAMTGSVISTVAFILAMFSPNIDSLILTFGVLGGFGFGMIYLPAIVSVGFYFEKKRAFATGIAVCGSGVGTFLFAPLSTFLLNQYDWKNALLILAGLILNACVFASLIRPLEVKNSNNKNEPPREKNVLDRIKEEAKKKRRRKFTSESSGIGPTDTTEILERVRLAKLRRENCLQETSESEICSLPSAYFVKDRLAQRQDSRTSSIRADGLKLSFSEKGSISKEATPTHNLKVMLEGIETGFDESSIVDAESNSLSELGVSPPASPIRFDGERPELTKKRISSVSNASQKSDKIMLPNGIQAIEIQPLIKIDNGGRTENNTNKGREQSLAGVTVHSSVGSKSQVWSSMRSILSKDYSRPLYRKDIFYNGSIKNISEFRCQPDVASYITSITSIPGDLGVTDTRMDTKIHSICRCLPKPIVDVMSEMLDLSLLSNGAFLCICLGNMFAMIGFYVPYAYLVDRAVLAGIGKEQASYLLSVIGITNTVGRIISGIVADLKFVDSLMLNNVAMLVASLAVMVIPFCSTYPLLVIAALVFGLMTAVYVSLTSVILCDLFGLDKLTNAFGLLSLARGISSTVGPPIAGVIYQSTGNYDASFFLSGALFVLGTLMHFVLYLPGLRSKKETDAEDTDGQMEAVQLNSDPKMTTGVEL